MPDLPCGPIVMSESQNDGVKVIPRDQGPEPLRRYRMVMQLARRRLVLIESGLYIFIIFVFRKMR